MAVSLVRCLALLGVLAGVAVSRPQPTRVSRNTSPTKRDDAASTPQSTICGEIIDAVNQGNDVFFASDAYDCLQSVPFNAAVAARLVNYYSTSVQFQSTLAYLKNPPWGYQQPGIDVVGELTRIQAKISENGYTNEYDFETDLQTVVYGMHDAHVDLYAGILSAFTFASPYNLISASKDGKAVPDVYIKDDIVAVHNGFQFNPSPVVAINSQGTADFLTSFAALQAVGYLEPHADWNSLMGSPAQDIQGGLNIFGGGLTFYPGDSLNFTLANGTIIETFWIAFYSEPYYTGPLSTGGDFFNYFVLGLVPASINDESLPPAFQTNSTDTNSTDADTGDAGSADTNSSAWIPFNASTAYPVNPDVVQDNLGISAGSVTGYFLNDTATGVISIPTFDQFSGDVGAFSDAVADFINRAQEANLTKVIIDLQGNSGGLVELAFVTFRQFFPGQTPFAGSRRRSHNMAGTLGETFTDHWNGLAEDDDEKIDLEANEWVVTERLNADTNKNFTSWKEYFGPRQYNGDDFSLIERYDLANTDFDIANFDGWVPVDYTAAGPSPTPPTPWEPDSIVLLTDGACSSACSLFVEMVTRMGVKTVVAGGRPVAGPMQAVAGTRGAHPYDVSELDSDIAEASKWLGDSAAASLPQDRDSGVYISWAGFNLRDQIRQGDDTALPLQFTYIPADCRLYYTLANVWNMSALWRDVGAAAFQDPSLCASGSTAAPGRRSAVPPPPPPPVTLPISTDLLTKRETRLGEASGSSSNATDGPDPLTDGLTGPKRVFTPKVCNPKKESSQCDVNTPCEPVEFRCGNQLFKNHLCVPRCNNHGGVCPNNKLSCGFKTTKELGELTFGISSTKVKQTANDPLRKGFCVPLVGTKDMCSTANGAVLVPSISTGSDNEGSGVSPSGGKGTTGGKGGSKDATSTTTTTTPTPKDPPVGGSKDVTTNTDPSTGGVKSGASRWKLTGSTATFKSGLLGDIWI